VKGAIGLHGGGEFQAGDEPFLARSLSLAVEAVEMRGAGKDPRQPIRVAIVPTAAARGRPALVGEYGRGAFERVAASGAVGRALSVEVALVAVLDAASAADAELARRLAGADLIHFPGGDPDLIPAILPGTAVWQAIVAAHERGAVIAGASAGAMALADWTWTPGGGVTGLGLVQGLVVVPHADPASWASAIARFGTWLPDGYGLLGVTERTGVISRPRELSRRGEAATWDVVGEGEARWMPAGADEAATLVVAAGGSLLLPA
jgi:cyanophycinase